MTKEHLLCAALFILLGLACSRRYLNTCAKMDLPSYRESAKALCITSCRVQRCGTGLCESIRGRKACVCYRCARGGDVPLADLVAKTGK